MAKACILKGWANWPALTGSRDRPHVNLRMTSQNKQGLKHRYRRCEKLNIGPQHPEDPQRFIDQSFLTPDLTFCAPTHLEQIARNLVVVGGTQSSTRPTNITWPQFHVLAVDKPRETEVGRRRTVALRASSLCSVEMRKVPAVTRRPPIAQWVSVSPEGDSR